MNGAGKKVWGYYPAGDVWLPLQVDVNGKVVVDMSGINLGDLGDVRVPAPGDQNFLYWDATSGKWTYRILVDADIPAGIARDAEVAAAVAATDKRFYALTDLTCIWREWGHRVSSTPRTATVSSIAGDVITLTANEAYRFGEWGASPEYMNAASVYAKIYNIHKAEVAWVKASPAANKLQVTVAADIAAWVNGNTITTTSPAAANFEELDISPLIPDGATMVFLKAQADDTGAIAWATGLQLSKQGFPGTTCEIGCQAPGILNSGYPVIPIQSNRHIVVRDRATGIDTLQLAVFAAAYIK